jgi:DNA-binding response OmpR family regulator
MSELSIEDTPRIRVLVIDDNPTVHQAFDAILEREARNNELEADEAALFRSAAQPGIAAPVFEVDHALSGLEGVEKVDRALERNQPYQVAFVDIRMPGIDGVETIDRFWKIDSRVQTVICTAYADYRWEDLTKRFGQTDRLLVLKKPFHDVEVLQLASTLGQKWFLAKTAAMKLEQMETLVAQRTEKLLAVYRREHEQANRPESGDSAKPESVGTAADRTRDAGAVVEIADEEKEQPVILMLGTDRALRTLVEHELNVEYRVLQAADTEKALLSAREDVPDLVVVDRDGFAANAMSFCAELKRDAITSHVPIVLLSGDASDVAQLKALEAGVDDYLAKPLRLPLLRARVNNLLESRKRLHRYFADLKSVQPRELAGNRAEAEFLRRVVGIVEKNLADYEFDVELLARQMAVSRRQLFRKFKAVAGCTPNVFIRNIRLKHAAQLLQESEMTVSEIIYAVGFSDPKYFRTVFRERFGVLPGEYGKNPGPAAS